MTKEEREYILDGEQGDYPLYDTLDWDELYSLESSNTMSWAARKTLRHMYMPQRSIREFAPIIGLVAVANIIMEFIIKESKSE